MDKGRDYVTSWRRRGHTHRLSTRILQKGSVARFVSIDHAAHAPTSAITSEGCMEVRPLCLKLAFEGDERIERGKSNKFDAGIV